jgi:hypothetical protein
MGGGNTDLNKDNKETTDNSSSPSAPPLTETSQQDLSQGNRDQDAIIAAMAPQVDKHQAQIDKEIQEAFNKMDEQDRNKAERQRQEDEKIKRENSERIAKFSAAMKSLRDYLDSNKSIPNGVDVNQPLSLQASLYFAADNLYGIVFNNQANYTPAQQKLLTEYLITVRIGLERPENTENKEKCLELTKDICDNHRHNHQWKLTVAAACGIASLVIIATVVILACTVNPLFLLLSFALAVPLSIAMITLSVGRDDYQHYKEHKAELACPKHTQAACTFFKDAWKVKEEPQKQTLSLAAR